MADTPTINPNRQEAPVPEVGDYGLSLSSLRNLGMAVAERRRENLVGGVREQIEDLYSQMGPAGVPQAETIQTSVEPTLGQASQQIRTLAEYEESLENTPYGAGVAEYMRGFQAEVDRLSSGRRQGRISPSEVEWRAEDIVRAAQTRYPELTADFQRAAAGVLGSNPIGTQLAYLRSLEQSSQQRRQERYDDLIEHGRQVGMDYFWSPDNPEQMRQFAYLQRIDSLKVAAGAEAAYLLDQMKTLNTPEARRAFSESAQINFAATTAPLNDMIRMVAAIPPAQQAQFWQLSSEDQKAQFGVSIAELQADARQRKAGFEAWWGQVANTEIADRFSAFHEQGTAFFDDIIDLNSTNPGQTTAKLNTLAAAVSALEANWMVGQPSDVFGAIQAVKHTGPFLELLFESIYPTLNSEGQKFIGDILPSILRAFSVMTGNPGEYGQPNGGTNGINFNTLPPSARDSLLNNVTRFRNETFRNTTGQRRRDADVNDAVFQTTQFLEEAAIPENLGSQGNADMLLVIAESALNDFNNFNYSTQVPSVEAFKTLADLFTSPQFAATMEAASPEARENLSERYDNVLALRIGQFNRTLDNDIVSVVGVTDERNRERQQFLNARFGEGATRRNLYTFTLSDEEGFYWSYNLDVAPRAPEGTRLSVPEPVRETPAQYEGLRRHFFPAALDANLRSIDRQARALQAVRQGTSAPMTYIEAFRYVAPELYEFINSDASTQ
ncbi:MAG: hypothetical protein VW236_07770 [Flavobacteriaceae bacterium]